MYVCVYNYSNMHCALKVLAAREAKSHKIEEDSRLAPQLNYK